MSDRRKARGEPSQENFTQTAELLGKRIRALREANDWTLEEAGDRMGLDSKHLWKLESAYGSRNPTLSTLVKIAWGLGVPLEKLFEGIDPIAFESNGSPKLEFLDVDEVEPYDSAVPLFDLEVVAGNFGSVRPVSATTWVRLPGPRKLRPGMFVARVSGHSMEPLIPADSYVLFRSPVEGSREGLVVLVQHHAVEDPETGGSYTVKRYESDKVYDDTGQWRHTRIRLVPTNPNYEAIVITEATADSLKVVAEVLDVLGRE